MLYRILRSLLFLLEPELAHHLSLTGLKMLQKLHILRYNPKGTPRTVMGLTFPNPVGLAAGMDKNGDYIDALACMGFGFIEIGTVTPRPQPGNPKPRLFRIPQAGALINRMGFNNKGVDYLVKQVKKARYSGVLGINIGKNFDTPIEKAVDDYLICMRKVYAIASYITINISSPNTPGLRDLQYKEHLDQLLKAIKGEQGTLEKQHGKYTPIALKISPDLTEDELNAIAHLLLKHRIDAVIATNTTLSRKGVEGFKHAKEAGGLSGKPLKRLSLATVKQLSKLLKGDIPIIGVGGIQTTDDQNDILEAGAELVQVYSAFVFNGEPPLNPSSSKSSKNGSCSS